MGGRLPQGNGEEVRVAGSGPGCCKGAGKGCTGVGFTTSTYMYVPRLCVGI